MSQVVDYVISGTPLTMAQLATELGEMFAAVASENRGNSAPSNPFEGMLWQDSTATPVEYIKKYTVTFGWVILASLNITTGVYTPYLGGVGLGNSAVKTVGVAADNVVQVDQTIASWTRAATTTLGTSINGTLSDTSTTITAFNGVAGVTYHCRCLGAGSITHHATNLIITQGLASKTTAAGDTFDVEMITASTCRIKNYQQAVPIFASSAENAAGAIENIPVDPLGIREAFNATGTAPIYACRAWINFDGTATPPTIRGSGNVSSITDNGAGDYTINFTTAMPDGYYATSVQAEGGGWKRLASGGVLAGSVRVELFSTTNVLSDSKVHVSVVR